MNGIELNSSDCVWKAWYIGYAATATAAVVHSYCTCPMNLSCLSLPTSSQVIMALHDIPDVFLETGKCLNYMSKAKGQQWIAFYTDIFFGKHACDWL